MENMQLVKLNLEQFLDALEEPFDFCQYSDNEDQYQINKYGTIDIDYVRKALKNVPDQCHLFCFIDKKFKGRVSATKMLLMLPEDIEHGDTFPEHRCIYILDGYTWYPDWKQGRVDSFSTLDLQICLPTGVSFVGWFWTMSMRIGQLFLDMEDDFDDKQNNHFEYTKHIMDLLILWRREFIESYFHEAKSVSFKADPMPNKVNCVNSIEVFNYIFEHYPNRSHFHDGFGGYINTIAKDGEKKVHIAYLGEGQLQIEYQDPDFTNFLNNLK